MSLTRAEIASVVDEGLATMDVAGKRVVLIVPDNTTTEKKQSPGCETSPTSGWHCSIKTKVR